MKKIISIFASVACLALQAQFDIHISTPANLDADEAFLYTLSGSKDILEAKLFRKNGSWDYRMDRPYTGMMKIYIPKHNNTLNFISENKDVNISFEFNKNKITIINYLDTANRLMDSEQDILRKKDEILPALYQMQEFYRPDSDFGIALAKESARLAAPGVPVNADAHPFVAYYEENYPKFLQEAPGQKSPAKSDIIKFISNSDFMLESSGLMRPVLLDYIKNYSKDPSGKGIDDLLAAVNVETPRGQIVLAEIIDILDAYNLETLKNKYLGLASGLKCTINERLAGTIRANKDLEIGGKFPDYKFTNVINTSAKSIYNVKAAKKIILFWASTCSHCEAQIPILMQHYNQLKSQGAEVIGLSFDSDQAEYAKKANALPWINDAELRGWYSSYAETYNIHGTPTYFVLDADNKIIAKPDNVQDVLEFFKLK